MKTLTVVPARAGSKGLPGKNVKLLLGKPLLAWSIEQGLACGFSEKVIVSTDCPQIAKVARQYGGSVPFLRPPELARDETPTIDVLLHLLDWLREAGEGYDVLQLLEPTSPLRDTADLQEAYQKLCSTPGASSVVGVSAVHSAHPEFLVKVGERGFLKPYGGGFSSARRQDIEPLYFLEGSLYLSHVEALYAHRGFYHSATLAHEVPKWKSFEIDDPIDFAVVEALMGLKVAGDPNLTR